MIFHPSLNSRTGEDGHLKLNLSNKTANIDDKTCQFTTKGKTGKAK